MKFQIFAKELIVTNINYYHECSLEDLFSFSKDLFDLFDCIVVKYNGGTINYLNKKFVLDRKDGPAVIFSNGWKFYYRDGKELKFNYKIKRIKKFSLP